MMKKELTLIKVLATVLATDVAGTAAAPPYITSALICFISAEQRGCETY